MGSRDGRERHSANGMVRRAAALALLLLPLIAALDGPVAAQQPDAGGWTVQGGNPARTREAAGGGPSANAAVLWRFSDPASEFYGMASPLVADGNVYAFAGDGRPVFALDPATGAVRWSANVGYASGGDPGVLDYSSGFTAAAGGGMLFVSGSEGEGSGDSGPPPALYAIDAATGNELWRKSYMFDGQISAPLLIDGLLFITVWGESERLVALDAATGQERWTYDFAADTGTDGITVADGTVYAAVMRYRRGGGLLALDLAMGSQRWLVDRAGYPLGAPVVAGGTVFGIDSESDIGNYGIYAVDAATGAERWRVSAGPGSNSDIAGPLTVADGLVYEATHELTGADPPPSQLRALDAATGAERWHVDGLGVPVAAGGLLYANAAGASSADGFVPGPVVALDAATGAEAWRLEGAGRVSSVAGGRLFAVSGDTLAAVAAWDGPGTPVALETTSGAPPNPTPCIGTEECPLPPGEAPGDPGQAMPTLFLANADGSNPRPVGSGDLPVWSPDGSQIAYVGSVLNGQETDIYVANADGSNPHSVAQLPGYDSNPSWAPDGTKLAFTSGFMSFYVVNADGTGLTRVADMGTSSGPVGNPFNLAASWSPDGTRLAVASAMSGETNVWVVNADGSGATQITEGPVVGPPVGAVAFHTVVTVLICPPAQDMQEGPGDGFVPLNQLDSYRSQGCAPASEGQVTLTVTASRHANTDPWILAQASTGADGTAVLDGRLLAEAGGFYSIDLLDTVTGFGVKSDTIEPPFAPAYAAVVQPILMDGAAEGERPPMDDYFDFFVKREVWTAPAWSPDGSRIACLQLIPGDEGRIAGGGVWVMAPDCSGKTRLTDVVPEEFSPPVWSPDGSRLLVASAWSDDGPGSLYVVNADGSGATPVTAPGTYVEHPGWSADGDRIHYWTVGPNGAGMYSVDTDGADPQLVLPAAPAGGPLVAAPDGQTVAYVVYPEFESDPVEDGMSDKPDDEYVIDEDEYDGGTGE